MSAVTLCVFYLRYVMEKAMLVLVREKRALATPLELGSHESVTPVNTATKSAGENQILTNVSSNFTVLLVCSDLCVCISLYL